ncbi:MAG: hypothetical protein JOZ42_11745 [Acetobacteraceae bacterium]|nr:hypothetical protein [Acetobacteraceae bacterium]
MTLDAAGVAKAEGLGRAFETFSVFGGTPGIAAAKYYSDVNLNSYQLPVAHSFAPLESGFLSGVAPYAEITLGYLNADTSAPLEGGGPTPDSVKLSFNSYSGLAGGGVEISLGHGFKLRPIALAGYARVDVDARFSGPDAPLFRSALRGILNSADLDTVLLGGALELLYETEFPGDITLAARARYNELAAIVTGASNKGLKENGGFGVATGGVTFTGPTDWRLAAHELRWIGYLNGTWLPDTDPGTLGFNAFAEIGGGLQLIAPDVVRGVRGGTVRASAIVGPGVTGWLVSAALDF